MNQSHNFAWRLDGAEAIHKGFQSPAAIALMNYRKIKEIEKKLAKEIFDHTYNTHFKNWWNRCKRDITWDDGDLYRRIIWPDKALDKGLINKRQKKLLRYGSVEGMERDYIFDGLNLSELEHYVNSDFHKHVACDKLTFYYPTDWFRFVTLYQNWTVKEHFMAEDFLLSGLQYFYLIPDDTDRRFFQGDIGYV